MSANDKPEPIFLDPSLLAPVTPSAPAAPSAAATAAPAASASDADPMFADLAPLDTNLIPEKFRNHVNPASPPPVRMMGARAMVPMPPKDMVLVVYQAIFDPDPKIGAMARKTFAGLDDKILDVAVKDAASPQVLNLFARTLIEKPKRLEQVLLNRTTPDSAFVYVGRHSQDQEAINMIAGNQERLLRTHDIVRAIAKNPHALRSELDRAIDFLVREGVFLEDVDEFEEAFLRLGKAEMLDALKRVAFDDDDLTDDQKRICAEHGVTAEELMLGTSPKLAHLEEQSGGEGHSMMDDLRGPLAKLGSMGKMLKAALMGTHVQAMEGVNHTNRVIATAAIRNPKITEQDVMKIIRSRTLADEVIRYICNNGDWTKSYSVKLSLVQHPKTPFSLAIRWMPLLRGTDLKALAKSKNIPSAVQMQAKKMTATRG